MMQELKKSHSAQDKRRFLAPLHCLIVWVALLNLLIVIIANIISQSSLPIICLSIGIALITALATYQDKVLPKSPSRLMWEKLVKQQHEVEP